MPQPPALRLEGRKRAMDLVLRASTDSTATSERKPVASPKGQPEGREEQQAGERRRPGTCGHEPEQDRDYGAQRRLAGVGEPTVLLAARIVQAPAASSRGPRLTAISHALNTPIARSCHRRQTGPAAAPVSIRATGFPRPQGQHLSCSLPPILPPKAIFVPCSKVAICRERASTATGIRTWLSREPLRAIRVTSLSTFMSICCPRTLVTSVQAGSHVSTRGIIIRVSGVRVPPPAFIQSFQANPWKSRSLPILAPMPLVPDGPLRTTTAMTSASTFASTFQGSISPSSAAR